MMGIAVISISIVTAIIVTGQVLVYARRHLLDRVTERSSHQVPTPRGGGVGLVAAVVAAWVVGLLFGGLWTWTAGVVLASLVVLAMLGWWDDHVGLRARSRLPVQLGVAGAVVWALGLPGTGAIGPWAVSSPVWLSALVAVFGAIWMVNLTNFMDGIDGLAGSQGMVAGFTAAVLLGMDSVWGSLGLATAGACFGFLWWNRPPARIFMGDVGSTALGLIFAVLILAQVGQGIAIEVALLPLAPFVLDATFTLIRRAWRREALAQAHRSHLYQRLSRIWGGHLAVTVAYTVLASIAAGGAWLAHQAWISSSIVVAVVVGTFTGLSWYARRVAPA